MAIKLCREMGYRKTCGQGAEKIAQWIKNVCSSDMRPELEFPAPS